MRRKQDHFTRKARASGFPARSVYKLEEIQKRFGVLAPGMRILDIGSAPGSWTLFAARVIGPSGSILAVDLKDAYEAVTGPQFTFYQGDIHEEATRTEIARHAPFDCILSDAAPSTTGNRTVDSSRSAAIAESVVDLAKHHLVAGGNLVVKIFQGGDQQALLAEMRHRFTSAKQVKPEASRKESFEVFLVGLGLTPDR